MRIDQGGQVDADRPQAVVAERWRFDVISGLSGRWKRRRCCFPSPTARRLQDAVPDRPPAAEVLTKAAG